MRSGPNNRPITGLSDFIKLSTSGERSVGNFSMKTFCSNELGPVSRKARKLFRPVKPKQNLELYDYRSVLFTYS